MILQILKKSTMIYFKEHKQDILEWPDLKTLQVDIKNAASSAKQPKNIQQHQKCFTEKWVKFF